MTDYEDAARKLGADHGRAAGSWILDGNSSKESAQRLLTMIEDGDPALWEHCASPLSGEWAGTPNSQDVLDEIEYDGDDSDEILRAYEEAYSSGWESEVERLARIYAAED